MCGIAGIFNRNEEPSQQSHIAALISTIANRGPDGSGIRLEGPVSLGHRRLAILDLTDCGRQPMSRGRYWIVYNGEIYNFVELRSELESQGQQFLTNTDTEVILAAYQAWGRDCVLKFNGMWAFAIWDTQTRELFLSRDRFGIKPLHFLSEPRRFVFASELKCFLALNDFSAVENEDEMRLQLAGMESPEETLLQGVKLLRPGHNLVVSASKLHIWRWWRTLDHLERVPSSFAAQVERFRELFFDACRVRLRSDVPISTCLSGGLDSSSILCSIASMNAVQGRFTGDFHRAFVATFEGTPHDELAYAKEAIEKARAEPRLRAMDPGALIQDLPRYAYDFEMVGQALLLPIWALYRELRRDGVVVSLDGLGADELMMGYPASLRTHLLRHGSLLRSPLRTFDIARTVHRQNPHGESVAALLAKSSSHLRAAGRAIRRLRRVPDVRRVDSTWLKGWAPPNQAIETSELDDMSRLSPMNRDLYYQFHHGVNQSLLRKYDRLSMAHGIEVRMPFHDWRLVCYLFSLPDESKVGAGYGKRILREAMPGILPEAIRVRTAKTGFLAPLASWLNRDLGPWAFKRTQSDSFLTSEIWDGPAIHQFVAERNAAQDWNEGYSRAVWRYIQADLLREAFFSAKKAAAQ